MIPGLNQYAAQKVAVAHYIKNRAGWLTWAAGFSVVNTMLIISGSHMTFMIGLGASQLMLAIGYLHSHTVLGGFMLSLIPAIIFVGLGIQAGKRNTWAFYSAMALYGLDALLLLKHLDIFSAAFHGYVLFRLYEGLARINDYNELDVAEARMLRYSEVPGQQPEWSVPQGSETWPPAPAVSIDAPNLGWASQPTAPASAPQPGALPVDWARRLDPVPLPVSQPTDWANQPGGVIPPAQANPAAQPVPAADWANIPGGPTQPSLPQSGTQKWPPPRS